MMSVTSSVDTLDGVELVEGVVEADLGDCGAGDRREQGASERVAERVAEARLERADGEKLTFVVGIAERFDLRALHDQHVCLPRFVRMRTAPDRGTRPLGAYFE